MNGTVAKLAEQWTVPSDVSTILMDKGQDVGGEPNRPQPNSPDLSTMRGHRPVPRIPLQMPSRHRRPKRRTDGSTGRSLPWCPQLPQLHQPDFMVEQTVATPGVHVRHQDTHRLGQKGIDPGPLGVPGSRDHSGQERQKAAVIPLRPPLRRTLLAASKDSRPALRERTMPILHGAAASLGPGGHSHILDPQAGSTRRCYPPNRRCHHPARLCCRPRPCRRQFRRVSSELRGQAA